MKCSPTARGFGFGSGTGSAAEPGLGKVCPLLGSDMVRKGENGTAAFPGKSRNRDGFARSPRRRLVTVTLVQSVPWTIGLCFSLLYFRRPYPDWLYDWLVISYGLLFIGQIRAWWIPYHFRPEPKRAARYQIMFGKTHSFLPTRNGMVPNTAHILLHWATAATLIVLLVK